MPPTPPTPPAPVRVEFPANERITILLATYNGAAHLAEQLASYAAQTDPGWDLWISDDGSTDDTRALLERFRESHSGAHRIRLLEGPQRGAAANFLYLLTHPDLPCGPVALSDQDDVWLPEKLARARAGLASAPRDAVVLYGAQTLYTDPTLREIGRSHLPPRPPSFRNALTQNIVSGHSSVLSAEALALARRAGAPAHIAYHDWWLYQLIAGAGGRVVIDPAHVLRYRQHRSNVLGAHHGKLASLRRAWQVLDRSYGNWIDAHTEALAEAAALLTPENRRLLEAVRSLPPGPGLRRPLHLGRQGLYRQTRLATAGLYLAAGLGRV